MAKITSSMTGARIVDAPAELVSVLETAGFDVDLSVRRRDGRPLAPADEKMLVTVLCAYEAGRDLDLTEQEAMAAVARCEPKATGTGSE